MDIFGKNVLGKKLIFLIFSKESYVGLKVWEVYVLVNQFINK